MAVLQKIRAPYLKILQQTSSINYSFHYGSSYAKTQGNEETTSDKSFIKKNSLKILSAIGVGSALSFYFNSLKVAEAKSSQKESLNEEFGIEKPGLPKYTAKEVAKHNTLKDRVWITYKTGVYDITDFVNKHPGGDQIMIGAGGSVEPFWALYSVHQDPHILKLLEKYRIGNLNASDVGADVRDMSDPYYAEPRRHVALRPSSLKPFNAEPPPAIIVETLKTPNDIFYVRNHLPVPEVDPATYELDLSAPGLEEDITLRLSDLEAMPQHAIVAAVQCGGNRRSEMAQVKSVKGLSWGHAAISNAEWSGPRLCDVLEKAGVKADGSVRHVQFEGLDFDLTGNPYGASIPVEKALDPQGSVLLAMRMNGETLPRDHGFPVRVIVPGVVGARSVKWLGRIVLSAEESTSHWQQNDYKGFAPNVDWSTVDFSKSPAIQETPVTSAICQPERGDKVKIKDGHIEMRGYAYSGGGRKIIRVDVSVDGGKSWQEAQELESDPAVHPNAWGWTLWRAKVPVKTTGPVELVAKAIDSNYNSQPENFANIWNLRGVLSHAYHRVNVTVVEQ